MTPIRKFLAGFFFLALSAQAELIDLRYDYGRQPYQQLESEGLQKVVLKGAGGIAAGGTFGGPLLGPDGTACGAPSYSFTNATTSGMTLGAANSPYFCANNAAVARLTNGAGLDVLQLNFASSIGSTTDITITRDAANTTAIKNTTNAQLLRLYFSTTGPVYFQQTARTAGVLFTGVGGAMQLSFSQTTVPTCSSNCGTSPSVVGTDSAGIVTMGSSGVPASAWVVTFNGTWPAAPACIVQSALATMVVGKMPIAVVTTTTTMTVTTNGTAPATSDKYQYQCTGVS